MELNYIMGVFSFGSIKSVNAATSTLVCSKEADREREQTLVCFNWNMNATKTKDI